VQVRVKKSVVGVWVLVLLAATSADTQIKKSTDDGDLKESYLYVLNMDKIHKLQDIRNTLSGLLTGPTVDALEHDQSLTEGTFTERAKVIDLRYPQVSAIILKKGMLTREYLVATHVLVQMLLQVTSKERRQPSQAVNPANVALFEQHQNEIRKSLLGLRIKM